MAAQSERSRPKLGSEVGFVVVVKAKGKVNVEAVMKLMMRPSRNRRPRGKEEGRVDGQDSGGTTYLTLPKELMTDPSVDSDMMMSVS